jgi:hypothetical protein
MTPPALPLPSDIACRLVLCGIGFALPVTEHEGDDEHRTLKAAINATD